MNQPWGSCQNVVVTNPRFISLHSQPLNVNFVLRGLIYDTVFAKFD